MSIKERNVVITVTINMSFDQNGKSMDMRYDDVSVIKVSNIDMISI